MTKTIRYSKDELLVLREQIQEDGDRWESMVSIMGDTLYQELCSLAVQDCNTRPTPRRRKNTDKRQRQEPKKESSVLEDVDVDVGSLKGNGNGQHEHCLEDEDEYDDSDEEVSLQPLAFYVEGEPDFESGPPQDGFEYLRRVIWETAQCPKVKVAKISEKKLNAKQTNYMPEIRPIPSCSPELLPSNEWVQTFMKDFSELRASLVNIPAAQETNKLELPSIRNADVWKSFCFGRREIKKVPIADREDDEEASSTDDEAENICHAVASSPFVNILLCLDEVSRATLFRYHVSWLKDLNKLTYERAIWLFALAAVVDTPLDDQTSAAFRDLLRICADFRIEKQPDDEELHMLNILITIAGEYFGQADYRVMM